MTYPMVGDGDITREMTEEEYADYVASGRSEPNLDESA